MLLKYFKPVTPSLRGRIAVDRKSICYKGQPKKSLIKKNINKSAKGRNRGTISSGHKGGRGVIKFRDVDFYRNKWLGVPAVVERIEYDPNRTAFIALIKYEKHPQLHDATDAQLYSYILAPQKLEIGGKVVSADIAEIKVGNAMLLKNMPEGTIVHNVELAPGRGAQLVKAAGSSAQLMSKDDEGYVLLRLPSGEVRKVLGMCRATIGLVSNQDHKNEAYGKAGRKRWLGHLPKVRGTAKNPVDHPHGGRNFGTHPKTPTGKPTKGKRTRINKRTDKFIVTSRHKK